MLFERHSFALAVTPNLPLLSPCASWNPNAVTFANYSASNLTPAAVFIDPNNTVYVTGFNLIQVKILPSGGLLPSRIIPSVLNQQQGVAIANNGDVFVSTGSSYYQITWPTWIGTVGGSTIGINESCFSLYADQNNSLYCSMNARHMVVKRSFSSASNATVIVAGNGSAGSASSTLSSPRGILVTVSLDLYVADCGNNRVQLFSLGQLSGTAVAGNGASGTIAMSCPAAVSLDADGYLFIVDQNNHRVVGAGPTGYRCIVGCAGQNGSASFQLLYPSYLAFDVDGNLFVNDASNGRIQQFMLGSNACSEWYSIFSSFTIPSVILMLNPTLFFSRCIQPTTALTLRILESQCCHIHQLYSGHSLDCSSLC